MNLTTPSRSIPRVVILAAIGMFTFASTENVSAQYYGGPAFGSRLSITIGGPAWGPPPVFGVPPMFAPPPLGRFAPAYSAPFAYPPRYMARRQAIVDRYAAAYALPPFAPVFPVRPLPPYESLEPIPELPRSQYVPQDSLGGILPESELPPGGDSFGDGDPFGSGKPFVGEQGAFAAAAARLNDALSRRENGDVWIEYLQCDLLARFASVGQLPAAVDLENLAARYQGVLANPDLVWLQSTDGFYETMVGLNASTNTGDQGESLTPRSNQPTAAPGLESAKVNADADTVPNQNREGQSVLEPSSTEELPAPAPETQSL